MVCLYIIIAAYVVINLRTFVNIYTLKFTCNLLVIYDNGSGFIGYASKGYYLKMTINNSRPVMQLCTSYSKGYYLIYLM